VSKYESSGAGANGGLRYFKEKNLRLITENQPFHFKRCVVYFYFLDDILFVGREFLVYSSAAPRLELKIS
jgi:hypothetical protein